MSSQALDQFAEMQDVPAAQPPIVVVGSGPVGVRTVQELLRRDPHCAIVLYGDEPWEPYNRVRLSSFLSGADDLAALRNALTLPLGSRVVQHHHCAVTAIDREAAMVSDALGRVQPYQRLILATGSRAHIPAIPGIELPGVFAFRDLNDAQRLLARRVRSRHTVVLGGGVLGLETARAMQRQHTQVTAIEHNPRLMGRQLDAEAARRLRRYVQALGIAVLVGTGVKRVLGAHKVMGVELGDQTVLPCDTIVLATGIRPNIDLALDCGLSVGRGVRVNDRMQSSDARIFAVGECAEHREQVYGLVAPGLEQAAVAAHCVLGGESHYGGSIAATRLKVLDRPVFSMGAIDDEALSGLHRSLSYVSTSSDAYRKLVLRRGRLVGAIQVGAGMETGRLQDAITRRRYLWPWQRLRFIRTGQLWHAPDTTRVARWPARTTVCNCMNVTRGALSAALQAGCDSVPALSERTGAATVCGSCKPLLAELVGAGAEAVPVVRQHPLLVASFVAALLALFICGASPIPYASTAMPDWQIDALWRDGLWKQVSGYTLLGLALLSLTVSLRKRWRRFSRGAFTRWRFAHAALGLSALLVLVAHTGFRLGSNLNQFLMVSFLAVALMGSVAGGVTALQAQLGGMAAQRLRRFWGWIHLIVAWPVPVLLTLHIVSVYYF